MVLSDIAKPREVFGDSLSVDYQGGETWVELAAFPNYLVSCSGRVRSVKFRNPSPLLSQRFFKGGKYLHVHMVLNGKPQARSVHRMVAEAFCEKRHGCNIVNHKDGNRLNNSADNLEWVTASENHRHAIDVLGVDYGCKIRRPVEALNPDGSVWQRFPSARAAEAMGFFSSCIANCVSGKRKTHKGYAWRYADAV